MKVTLAGGGLTETGSPKSPKVTFTFATVPANESDGYVSGEADGYEHLVGQQHRPRVHPGQQPGHDRVGQRRLMIRSISYSRYRKIATPMPAGSAASPTTRTSWTMDQTPCAAPIARDQARRLAGALGSGQL